MRIREPVGNPADRLPNQLNARKGKERKGKMDNTEVEKWVAENQPRCPSCGEQLEYGRNNDYGYCPSCGTGYTGGRERFSIAD